MHKGGICKDVHTDVYAHKPKVSEDAAHECDVQSYHEYNSTLLVTSVYELLYYNLFSSVLLQ